MCLGGLSLCHVGIIITFSGKMLQLSLVLIMSSQCTLVDGLDCPRGIGLLLKNHLLRLSSGVLENCHLLCRSAGICQRRGLSCQHLTDVGPVKWWDNWGGRHSRDRMGKGRNSGHDG